MTDKKAEIKQFLQNARQDLFATLDQISDEQWTTAVFSEGDTWTVEDILRHLTDSQRSMTGLMTKIRDTGEGVPDDFDLARWNASRVNKYRAKGREQLLTQLESDQAQLFSFIDALADDDWQKEGRHGAGDIISIEQICRIIGGHEQIHAADIKAAIQ